MTEPKKPTPAQRVKELEAEIKRLEKSILKLTDYTATYGNEQYGLGYDQGRLEMQAAFQAQTRIERWMYKA
jgi:hypothetical protein